MYRTIQFQLSLGRVFIPAIIIILLAPTSHAQQRAFQLEEVIVTAQKREESIQDASIAVSALTENELRVRGITGLSDLEAGAIPALKIQPFPVSPATLIVSVRGVGVANASAITRDPGVGIYIDEIYMGRAQSAGLDVLDLERIEVLRGPQGTLYGRNVVGGAVNLISKKPSGEFGYSLNTDYSYQYDTYRVGGHVDLPAFADVALKFSYNKTGSNGYIDNIAGGANSEDYTSYVSESYRVAVDWSPHDGLSLLYAYDYSETDSAQNYFQLHDTGDLVVYDGNAALQPSFADPDFFANAVTGAYLDNLLPFPSDPEGLNSKSRTEATLKPNEIENDGHSLTIDWDITDNIALKSITAYRQLEQTDFANFLGIFGVGIAGSTKKPSLVEQEQFSQEFRITGNALENRLEFVAGLYYFDEAIEEDSASTHQGLEGVILPLSSDPNEIFASLNIVPLYVHGDFVQLNPTVELTNNASLRESDTESWAAYSQGTYYISDALQLSLGLRYTHDEKSASREEDGTTDQVDINNSRVDYMVTLGYDLSDKIYTYLRYATGFKSGGVSLSSPTFTPFAKESLDTIEFGIKSKFWNNRAIANIAVFSSDYEDLQIDFSDPTDIRVTETFNAINGPAEISGFELDLSLLPMEGLTVSLNYTYLDWSLDPQNNPLSPSMDLESFQIPQAPKHSGAASVNYVFKQTGFGTPSIHAEYTGSDKLYYSPFNNFRQDARDLFNARLTLSDIEIAGGSARVAIWMKNITDEEYVVYSITDAVWNSVSDTYGSPRTTGFSISFDY